MTKTTYLAAVLTAFAFHRSATAGTPYSIEWSRQFGTSSSDSGNSVATDALGNIFVAGHTYGNLDGQVNSGRSDAYVMKYNASSSILWTQLIGTAIGDVGLDVAVDSAGNSFVSGRTRVPGSNGDLNGFVGKIDPNGTTLWTSQFGTIAHDQALSLSLDNAGSVYVTGYSSGNLDGQANSGGEDAFLRKLDSNGDLQWSRLLGTIANERSQSVSVDPSGNVYLAGITGGNLGGQQNSGSYDMFLTKYDSSGTLQWARLLGSPSSDGATAIKADGVGNIYLAGSSNANLDGQTNSGSSDTVLAKYDANGTRQWTRLLGTGFSEDAYDIALDDATGAIFMTGWTNGDLGAANQGPTDLFVTKWDALGNSLWTQQFGTGGSDIGYGVTVDTSGNVYVTGGTAGSLFGPDAGNSLESDAFLVKFTPEPASAVILLIASLAIPKRRRATC